MSKISRSLLSVLLATVWISISEFVRNQFIIRSYWLDHYSKIGMQFPSEPINGAIWGVWSLCFAISIYFISTKFNYLQTSILSWFIGFVLMWLVIGNLGVLPLGILSLAIPLSLLEAFLASFIIHKLSK